MAEQKEWLTTKEAAKLIGISVRQVQNLCANEILPSIVIGERLRQIKRSDAIAYRDSARKPGPKPSIIDN